jgi:superfamily II DNA or RNA helicase
VSTVSFDGQLLRIKLSGSGAKWDQDLMVVKKYVSGSDFLPGVGIWVAPPKLETISLLQQYGFKIEADVLDMLEFPSNKGSFETLVEQRFKEAAPIPGLFDCQVPHAKRLIYDLETNLAALDTSDTGTGKTYVALAIAKYLGLFPIVFTARSVVPAWQKIAKKHFGIYCYVNNYEQYKCNNTPFVQVRRGVRKYKGKEVETFKFVWVVPRKSLLIFDEVHRCKDPGSINSKLLASTEKVNARVLALSATIADNPLQMYAIGLVLGLFKHWFGFQCWTYERGVSRGYWEPEFSNDPKDLKKIHNDLYPFKASRLTVADFGDLFPDNKIICEPYFMESAKQIHDLYVDMREKTRQLRARGRVPRTDPILTQILRERQQVEKLKIATFIELARDHVAEGCSVAIFVNFRESVDILAEKLKTKCIIDGRVSDDEREANREAFQADKERIIICNTAAGGVGIGLHDITGKHPRVGLISPSYSAIDLKQVLGRLPRAGAKTKVIQKLIFCAETQEEQIAERVNEKMNNIDLINDGDLDG